MVKINVGIVVISSMIFLVYLIFNQHELDKKDQEIMQLEQEILKR